MTDITVSLDTDRTGAPLIAFSIQISAKTSWTIIPTETGVTVVNDKAARVFGTLGRDFPSLDDAIQAYKAPKLRAALAYLPEYIVSGMKGTVTI